MRRGQGSRVEKTIGLDDMSDITYSNQLVQKLTYLSEDKRLMVYKAVSFAEKAHQGVFRKDGTPYISHPLAVLEKLADLKLNHHILCAAALHDVIEDTTVTKKELEKKFNTTVAELVDGVTKLEQLKSLNLEEKQANNLYKMLVAMVKDPSVFIIKLADRLHNMETLSAMKRTSQRRIAKETSEIYIQMAGLLGVYYFKRPLQDLAFKYLYPYRYQVLEKKYQRVSQLNAEARLFVQQQMIKRLNEQAITSEVLINTKNISRIYKSMKESGLAFDKITSGLSFSILVDTSAQCYEVLGLIHDLFTPIPGRFKDYIGMPKINGYQSLHTKVVSNQGYMVEIQILTHAMRQTAMFGLIDKLLNRTVQEPLTDFKAFDWVSDFTQLQESKVSNKDLLKQVKEELAQNKIHVLTPKGDVHELPANATALDFAFSVHTEVGLYASSAIVNHRSCELSRKLKEGDIIQIITTQFKNARPVWLDWVATSRAKACVNKAINKMLNNDKCN